MIDDLQAFIIHAQITKIYGNEVIEEEEEKESIL